MISFLMQIWLANAPHTKLVEYKRPQNWVKVDGEYLTFPGGGTQFKHGALHYIDFIRKVIMSVLLVLPSSYSVYPKGYFMLMLLNING